MRRLLSAFLVLLPALAFAANPVTLESRSQHHSLTIDVIPIGEGVEYSARVIDLDSGELLASATFDPRENNVESVSELRDLRIRIRVRSTYNGLAASMEIENGDALVDSMDARWTLKPGRIRLGGPAGAVRVGGDVKAPTVMEKVEPMYSEEARKAHISGIVILEAVIDQSGAVRDVAVLKGLPYGLSESAADAVRRWKFQPATKNGVPVEVVFNLTVNFRLDGKRPPG